MASIRRQFDHVLAGVAGFQAYEMAPAIARGIADRGDALFSRIPYHQGTAAGGGQADATAQGRIDQCETTAGALVGAVAASGIPRVLQVPLARLRMLLAVVAVGVPQAFQSGDVRTLRIADAEISVQG